MASRLIVAFAVQSDFVSPGTPRGGLRCRCLHSLDVTTNRCVAEPAEAGRSDVVRLGLLAAIGNP